MATDHNFRIKNGLTVGAVEVIDSSGKLTSSAFGTNSNEKIEDVVADMITGSTHSNITVTYNDTNGTLAFSAAAQYGDSDVESYLDGGTSTPVFSTITSNGQITSSGRLLFSDKGDYIQFGSGGTNISWTAPVIFREDSHLALSDYSGVKLGGYNGTAYGPRVFVKGDGNLSILDGALQIGNTTVIGSDRDFITDDKLTFDYNDHYFQAGTNSVAFKNSVGTSYVVISNTGLSVTGAIDGTKISVDSGSSLGLRLHSNSGITASNNYMNFFTSQTSGWSFNANGTGADSGSVFTISSTGAITATTVNTGHGANELYAMNQNVRTTDSPTFGGLTLNGGVDFNGYNINAINQINAIGSTGWLDFNMDADNVYPQASTDNQTVLGSVTHMNFVGDSNANGTGGIFYWGYGTDGADNGTFTQTMSLDRSGNLTTIGSVTATTVNTGQGATEVHLMNQNVRTTDSPTFNQVTTTNNGSGTNYKVGDDAWIGDINVANTIRISGIQNANNGYITFGNTSSTALGRAGTGQLTWGSDEIYHEGHKPTYSELGTMAYSNLTGTPTIPSLSGYATESYVGTQISNLVDSAPGSLDTLNELAAALGDDANFSTTVTNSIATKMPKAGGTFTGSLIQGYAAGTGEMFKWQNTTSGGHIQLGFQQNDTDGLHHRFYIKTYKGSASASGNVDLIVRGSGGSTTSDVLELHHGQRASWQGNDIFTDGYHPNADTLTTARTIAGTSFNGSANIDINYNNLTNKPTIPAAVTNNNQLTNGAGYITGESDTLGTVVSRGASTSNTVTMTGGIVGNSFRVRRQDNNGTIWFNGSSATDANHALWNAYYGTSPTTRGAANSGFDGIYWNTYRGLHIRGGSAGAIDCIKITNSSSAATDHNVTLYASNVARLATNTSGVAVTGNITVTGTVDGRDVSADGTKLDTIATNADVTPSWVPSTNPSYITASSSAVTNKLPLAGGTLTGNLNGTTASFSGKVDFQGTAAIEGGTAGSGYGVFKGYSPNDNHFIAVRGIVATGQSTPNLTGGHQTTFVEHAENNDTTGWFWKSRQTGTYQEIARLTRTGGFKRAGNQVWDAGNDGASSGLDADLLDGQHGSYYLAWANVTGKPTIPTNNNQLTNGAGYTTNVGDVTSVTADAPLSVSNGGGPNPHITFSSPSVTTSTSNADGDFFLVHSGTTNSGSLKKLTKANINISGFNNDSGFTTFSANQGLSTTNSPTFANLNTANTGYVGIGDDVKFKDVSVANTAGVVGQQNTDRGYLTFGNNTSGKLGRVTTGNLIWTGAFQAESHIHIGTATTTGTGTLYLHGSTANKTAEIMCTNGNLHIDADSGNAIYMNWYGGTVGTYFGNGAAAQVGHISNAGNLTLSGGINASGPLTMTQSGTTTSSYSTAHTHALRSSGNNGNGAGTLIQNDRGNHSWGTVAEFRINTAGDSDNPSIIFSSAAEGTNTWSVGYGYTDTSFRINRDHGRLNSAWGTAMMTLDRSGNATFAGNVTAYSDVRLKENIETIPDAVETIKKIRGVTFDWKETGEEGMGVIAQEIEAVPILKRLVNETPKDGVSEFAQKNVAYGNMVGLLIEAVKEQQEQIEELKSIINTLVESK